MVDGIWARRIIRRIFKLFSKSFSGPYRHVKKRDIVLMSISQRCNDLFLEQVDILSRPSLPGNTDFVLQPANSAS